MEETTQDKKTFKWGEADYLLDDFLKMHADQENYFYNFARDKGKLDDNAIALLKQAINSRINHIKSGNNYSADGVLDTDKVQNVSVQTRKKGLFRKEQYTDQDITEWAKYYVDKLLRQLKTHTVEDKNPKQGWDISKHGLSSYLLGQGLNPQEIFERYDLQDASNPEAARSDAQRRDLLKKYLPGYIEWLSSKGFDFSKNDNDWDDSYVSDLTKFIADFDTLDTNSITAALRKFGAGDAFTTAFTSNRWDLNVPAEQSVAEAKAKAEEEAAKKREEEKATAWDNERRGYYNTFAGLNDLRSAQIQRYAGVDRIFDLTDEDWEDFKLNQKISGPDAEKKFYDTWEARYKNNPFDIEVASIILPLKHQQGLLGSIDEGEYSGWLYDPSTINEERKSVVAVNPDSGKMEEIFIGNVKDQWEKMKQKFMVNNGYEDPMAAFSKEGGVLTMQTGGSFDFYNTAKAKNEATNAARAAASGNSPDVQKARDRIVSNGESPLTSEDPTLASPDAGFTGAEYARLASIAVDIGSLFVTPTVGAVMGVASSLTNFGADIADDGFQWGDVGNLLVNVGLDVVGWVPVVGDSLGTGTKLVRKLVKFAPKVMAGIAAIQGVSNLDGMTASWKKLTSGDALQKMTVQDWRNIQQSITLLVGGTRAVKNSAAAKKATKQAKVEDAVAVNVRDKKTGQTRQLFVNGETADAIRRAGGSKQAVEAELNKLEGFNGKFGDSGDFEVKTSGSWQTPIWRDPSKKGLKAVEWRGLRGDGNAQVSEVFDFSKVDDYGSSWGIPTPGQKSLEAAHGKVVGWLNNPRNPMDLRGTRTSESIDAEIKSLRTEKGIDEAIEGVKTDMAAHDKAKAEIDAQMPDRVRLEELRGRLPGTDKAALDAERAAITQAREVNTRQMETTQQKLKAAEDDLAALLKKKRIPKGKRAAHEAAIRNARNKISGNTTSRKGWEATEQRLNQRLADLEEYIALSTKEIELQRQRDALLTDGHTASYNNLQQRLAELQASSGTVGGRQVDWSIDNVLREAGIQNAFKLGGAINRNKLNKFLNYAKG